MNLGQTRGYIFLLSFITVAIIVVLLFFYFLNIQKGSKELFSANILGSLEGVDNNVGNVIRISAVQKLDKNKNPIEDIFEKVKEKDDNWASIKNGQYIRVVFERPLNNANDVTIYARALLETGISTGSPASIEVYADNGGDIIATFPEIKQGRSHKVLLTNLKIPTDTLDLKINCAVSETAQLGCFEIDWIVDPSEAGISITGGIKINSGIQIAAPSGTPAWACGDTLVDTRDSKEYPTVYITATDQCWMAENINVGTTLCPDETTCATNQTDNAVIEKYCYQGSAANCDSDGGLYQWAEAMQYKDGCTNTTDVQPTLPVQGVCPDGWHVSSDAEWYTLENSLWDGITGACSASRTSYDCSPAGDKLKAAGLCEGRTPCGTSGFNDLLAGYRSTTGSFYNLSSSAYFWSSVQSSSSAWFRRLYSVFATVYRGTIDKARGFSVRCLKD
jgi:uncharacterized protein (TIGR02145 family)